MKRTIILTITFAAFALAASAQTGKISVSGQRAVVDGDRVSVSFDASVAQRAVRSGHTLVYRPYLTDGRSRWTLPEIVVQSRRARIAQQRHAWISGKQTTYDNPVYARNGERLQYTASASWQPWMDGARLAAEAIDMGCCGSSNDGSVTLAENLTLGERRLRSGAGPVTGSGTETVIVLVDKPANEPKTTGDVLATTESYVLPVSEFDRNFPQVMFDDDREDALRVYFDVNSAVLDPFGHGNAGVMRRLLAAIRKLQTSPDSRVAQIVVAGFASPEGSFDLNDRLAYNRAAALKKYIGENSGVADERIHIYNGAEDWQGLRTMVEDSDMPNRDRVTDIIDLVPIHNPHGESRERALMKLDGGRTYRYMLRNFFPELRKAAYIKVFYENK
uniref:DUF3868 domain-containing protein n=1 Tax=termite gut metagenome TaxID=433724 RepID=S0DE84_9ZZZZ